MTTVRISGKDRSISREFLLPKRSATAVSMALGTYLTPAIVEERVTNDHGRMLGSQGFVIPIQKLMALMRNGNL